MIVGLTGGIASGKSESAKYFEELGAFCIDADSVAKELTCKDKPALQEIAKVFGDDILSVEGTLNRKKLADIIFSDVNSKLKVEEILHSRIISRINETISKEISEKEVIVVNAPLLFETGLDKVCDKIVTIKISYDIQVKRLALRDGLNDDEIKKRIASQMPMEEKVKLSDFVVDNSGSKKDLKRKIENIYGLLTSNFK
ncbi:MAG: dephospho-CoA kinase [Endomicrobium sp.]|jgi:dephospho-CoA kinase|nr:dephospho-CoA kinase [Endomicrobium sp.]MDR2427582.1 dephospho-CoA kinase [Endomicrobium sp.]